jgi:hypothetical protein
MFNNFYYYDISLNISLFGKGKYYIVYISCL